MLIYIPNVHYILYFISNYDKSLHKHKPPWPQKCFSEAKNRCRYCIMRISLIQIMYFSEYHFEKYRKNEFFLFTHFHRQNYLLRCMTVLPLLLTRLSAFDMARKFLQIIILLKLAFSTTLFIFFSYHSKYMVNCVFCEAQQRLGG